MVTAKESRVTVSLHLNKNLYTLLKRCSKIEKRPMSRIVDQLLENNLDKYQFETLEKWEAEEEHRRMLEQIEAHEEQDQEYDQDHAPLPIDAIVERLKKNLESLEKLKPNQNISRGKIAAWKADILSKYKKAEQDAHKQHKERKKRRANHWRDVCRKLPLE